LQYTASWLRITEPTLRFSAAGSPGRASLSAVAKDGAVAGKERYGGGTIVVCDFDPAWPAIFDQERARLRAVLGSVVTNIEHVGSTAVPGLAAKPIIDMLVGVRSLSEAKSSCLEPLQALGYTYIPEYESWLPGEMLFRKGVPGPWTHHVHVIEPSSPRWEEYILIRDYLRRHPEIAHAYANLKKALVFDDDIAGYRNAKRPFLHAVIAKAQAESGPTRDMPPSTCT
jgi:GrpB-like predicted nucleotidyltransferase (UPF0157 family)